MIIPKEFPYLDDPSRDAERIVFNKLKAIFGNEKNFDIYYNREIWSPYNPNIPEEVEGDFILFHAGKFREISEFSSPGDSIIFKSWIPHKVTNVTKGIRKTLSVWFYGPRLI